MNASVSIVCYKSKKLASGKHPLMLRIIKNRKIKYKSLGVHVFPKHWNFDKNIPRRNCPNKETIYKIMSETIVAYNKQILEFNSEQRDYTASSLMNKKTRDNSTTTVEKFYEELIGNFKTTGRVGNRLVYLNSFNSIKSFTNGNIDIPFSDIDEEWLQKYEQWMKNKKNKPTTISINLRTLRSAYNKAILQNITSQKFYPFKSFKISGSNTITRKRAIPKSDIIKIMNLDLENQNHIIKFSRDIFIFSYIAAGINFIDISLLQRSNVNGNRLSYVRQKTDKEVVVILPQQALDIINRYSKKESKYLFPILSESHVTPIQKQNRVHKVLAQVNKSLEDIRSMAQIDYHLTTYVARHSFATVLKKAGVNVVMISEALGHSDFKTTQIYLDCFDDDQMAEAMSHLL